MPKDLTRWAGDDRAGAACRLAPKSTIGRTDQRRRYPALACWCFVCAEPGRHTGGMAAAPGGASFSRCASSTTTAGKMNLNLQDVAGGLLLVVSKFTLAADVTSRGNRPGLFGGAAPPELGRQLLRRLCCAQAHAKPCAGGAARRVRRRHAGAPGQQRPGDDPASRSAEQPRRCRRQARCRAPSSPACGVHVGKGDHPSRSSVDAASPMRALSCATVQAAMPACLPVSRKRGDAGTVSSPTPASLNTTRMRPRLRCA